jgi:ATP-dependent helicase/nuclease subunit A
MSGSVVPGHLVGLAVHRFCETVRPGDNLQERLALAVQEAVPVTWVAAVAREAEPLVRQYRNSALFQDIGSSICRQEWRFNYHMQLTDGIAPDRLAFNGSIDCLLTYPDGSLGIIDYKTDVISTDDFTEKIAAYRWQIGLYALAAQAISGHPLRDARLYFVRIDQMVSIPVDQGELSVIRQELADACRTITNHRTDDHYQCNTAWCCYCNFSIFCPGRKL